MSGLKGIKLRIKSVKSSQKITQAMKMVAAAKFRKARLKLDELKINFAKSQSILEELIKKAESDKEFANSEMVFGKDHDKTHLLIIVSSDRGLCGGFNGGLMKQAKNHIDLIESTGKNVKILCIGKKGYELIKASVRHFKKLIHLHKSSAPQSEYEIAGDVVNFVIDHFSKEEFDSCSVIHNEFISALSQTVNVKHLLPLVKNEEILVQEGEETEISQSQFKFEPSAGEILSNSIAQFMKMRLFEALIESQTSEQGARMTAMDNASSNAKEMIRELTLQYNRTRQATITKELIEIISGAEAV